MPNLAVLLSYPIIASFLFAGSVNGISSTCVYNGVTYYPDQSIAVSLDQCVQVRCSWTSTGAKVELLPLDGCSCNSTCDPARSLRLQWKREAELRQTTSGSCNFNGQVVSASTTVADLKSHCVRLQCVAVAGTVGQYELRTKCYDGCSCAYEEVPRSCSTTSNSVETKFVGGGTAGSDCALTIEPASSSICQVRLDFRYANLGQPDSNGNCVKESFSVNQGPLTTPLCGALTGKHMYVNVDPNGTPLQLKFSRSTTSTLKSWDVKATQIPCGSENIAPDGCLQYYTAQSGTVSSFNMPISGSTSGSINQLSNHNYRICVNPGANSCGIVWEKDSSDKYAFTVSGNVAATLDDFIGTEYASSVGQDCTADYIVISGQSYCGLGFPSPVKSTTKPFFTLDVKTDADENPDLENRGFRLKYYQITSC